MAKRRNPYNIKDVMERDNCSEEEAIEKINQLKNKTSGSLASFIKRYGEEEGTKKFNEFRNKSINSKETFKQKYGSDWETKWNEYLKSKDSMSLEFHIKKYGNEEGTKKFQERLKSVNLSKESMIERYGKEEGLNKFNQMIDKKSYSCSTEGLTEKFGKEKALQINKSKSLPGKRNPMHGKPTPNGSGNGWSGWYKGKFFRSILELSYIKYLDDNGIEWESAEKNEYVVKYNIDGKERTYRADFVVHNDIIEIKPKKLINTQVNKHKFNAAKQLFGKRFKILTEDDFPVIDDISYLINDGTVKLMDRYMKKYENLQNKNI